MISIYIPINLIFEYTIKDNKVFKGLILNLFILLFSILLYWYIDIEGILKKYNCYGYFFFGCNICKLYYIKG